MKCRMIEMMNEHKPRQWLTFERAIAKANEGETIERRRLEKLCAGDESTQLTIRELRLIDAWLRQHGPGLDQVPLFRREEDLFTELQKAPRVSFFIGTRFSETHGSESVSAWDMRAQALVTDCLRPKDTEGFDTLSRDAGRPLSAKEWKAVRNRVTGNIIVAFGSPVACAASEYLMSDMFQVDPYRSQTSPLPVYFAHPHDDVPSTFAKHAREVQGLKANQAALIVNGQRFVSEEIGKTYGVVLAQRTAFDHAAFVVAGVSGPATMAAAICLTNGQIHTMLPDHTTDAEQPIVASIVSSDVTRAPIDRHSDPREVGRVEVVADPIVFRKNGEGGWSAD